ncbi:MAG TPA: sigma-70 family RNA polymerase sigma factor [Chthonomonadales bacterium]|nr:sigma-70 family RNA polymerase sigma factor [Chthonomonadales bacterium]
MELIVPSVQECTLDREQFDQLVRRHHRQAYNIAYRLAGNHADAEDITQEAFVRAFRFLHRYNPQMPFENWMYRIISNVFIDEVRRRPKLRLQSLDQPLANGRDDGFVLLEVPDPAGDPETITLRDQIDAPLQHALNSLPPDFRQTVVLADVEGLSYEEIADAMRCSLGTVRSRLHRGRKMMRARVGALTGDPRVPGGAR